MIENISIIKDNQLAQKACNSGFISKTQYEELLSRNI